MRRRARRALGIDLAQCGLCNDAGKIKGAGLDVFYTEPLPDGHPLYGLDNVLLSAHCADKTKEFQAQSMHFFVENAKRYAAGDTLLNKVDKERGY